MIQDKPAIDPNVAAIEGEPTSVNPIPTGDNAFFDPPGDHQVHDLGYTHEVGPGVVAFPVFAHLVGHHRFLDMPDPAPGAALLKGLQRALEQGVIKAK
jgi:hypothetical protein